MEPQHPTATVDTPPPLARAAVVNACALLFMTACGSDDDVAIYTPNNYWFLPTDSSPYDWTYYRSRSEPPLQPGEETQVVATFDNCLPACTTITDAVCELEWSQDRVLSINAWWVIENNQNGFLWFGRSCDDVCRTALVECGQITLPGPGEFAVYSVGSGPRSRRSVPLTAGPIDESGWW